MLIDNHFRIELPGSWPLEARQLIGALIDLAEGIDDTYADWGDAREIDVITSEQEGGDADAIRERLEPYLVAITELETASTN